MRVESEKDVYEEEDPTIERDHRMRSDAGRSVVYLYPSISFLFPRLSVRVGVWLVESGSLGRLQSHFSC